MSLWDGIPTGPLNMDLYTGRIEAENEKLRAEVADLKARLKALRARWCDCGGCLDCEAVARIGNLRLKNWRKP